MLQEGGFHIGLSPQGHAGGEYEQNAREAVCLERHK